MSTIADNPIDVALAAFEETAKQTGNIRWEMIEALRSSVREMKVRADDPARLIEVKMNMMNTLSSLLKDHEGSSIQNVKLRMSQKSNEVDQQMSIGISELLNQIKAINPGNGNPHEVNMSAVTDKLNDRFAECDLAISEEEMEEVTSHPRDTLAHLITDETPKTEE